MKEVLLKFLYGCMVSIDYNGKDFDDNKVLQFAVYDSRNGRKYGEQKFRLAEAHLSDDQGMTKQSQKRQKDS